MDYTCVRTKQYEWLLGDKQKTRVACTSFRTKQVGKRSVDLVNSVRKAKKNDKDGV